MKVTLLQGGAKKKGNTALVLRYIEDELTQLGHEISTIYLHDKNLKGCIGCALCKSKPDTIGCIQDDDMEEVLQEMVTSQAVIFSSPLYFWGVNSQLKSVIDRSYSLYTKDKSLVEGQYQGLVVTGHGEFEDNAEEVFTTFARIQSYHKSIYAGELYISGCGSPLDLPESVEKRARAFARSIFPL